MRQIDHVCVSQNYDFTFKKMVFGTCVIRDGSDMNQLNPESMSIIGEQDGFIVTFTVTLLFRHSSPSLANICYITPNNCKICIYGTTFRIGSTVIPMSLQDKLEANEMFNEAKDDDRAVIKGEYIGHGLIQFELGNIPPGEDCEVQMKCVCTASSSGSNAMFFKIPLDVCTPAGSVCCVSRQIKGDFRLSIRNLNPQSILQMTANVAANYNVDGGILMIRKKPLESAIFITTTLRQPLSTSCLIAGSYLAITQFHQFVEKKQQSNEFVFLVDCSGSMSGQPIETARRCLQFFIHSLPSNCFFNIIQFGSKFVSLFPKSTQYNPETTTMALTLIASISADFGGTNIADPLAQLFKTPPVGVGKRQLFILTDGEVKNTQDVITMGQKNVDTNRCFMIGLGNGADAGLVEGLARETNGRSEFVLNHSNLTAKVIELLECSLLDSITAVNIEIENHNCVRFSPFPIPSVSNGISQTIFAMNDESFGSVRVLITGIVSGNEFEELIQSRETSLDPAALKALFAFETIKDFNPRETKKCKMMRELSMEAGILCKETCYFGYSDQRSRYLFLSKYVQACAGGCGARPSPPEEFDENQSETDCEDLITTLISRQQYDGSWNNPEELQTMYNLKVKKSRISVKSEIFATALAIALLRNRYQYCRSEWMMIERKALHWLSSQVADPETIITDLFQVLSEE
jgi:uncharacterized protein YegL